MSAGPGRLKCLKIAPGAPCPACYADAVERLCKAIDALGNSSLGGDKSDYWQEIDAALAAVRASQGKGQP